MKVALDAYLSDREFMTMITQLSVPQRIGILHRFGSGIFGNPMQGIRPASKKQKPDLLAKMYAVQQSLWQDKDPVAQAFCEHQFKTVKEAAE